jgi:short-subunit dehydrogenase
MAVAVSGRRLVPLGAVASEITALGGRAVALPCDLAVAGERAGLVERVHAALGPLDLLVNNAGVLMGGDLASLAPSEIERAIAVNLTAPIELTRRALPDLAARRGAVVLVASRAGQVALPSASLYTATKTGLRAFGEALRYELEPAGVRLLIAYPPGTDTAMVRGILRAAGRPAGSSTLGLAAPEAVGERIVAALLAGRPVVEWWDLERVVLLLARLAPWLPRVLLRRHRDRLARLLAASRQEPGP